MTKRFFRAGITGLITNLPFPRRLLLFAVPLALGVFILTGLAYVVGRAQDGMQTLAYGEGLWTISQKEAVNALAAYNFTHEETYLLLFRAALAGPLAAGACREEARKVSPDLARAREGYLRLGLPPAQFADLFWFLRTAGRFGRLSETARIWERGELLLAGLEKLAEEAQGAAVYHAASGGRRHRELTGAIYAKVEAADRELIRNVNDFHKRLTEDLHWLHRMFLSAAAAIFLLLIAPALALFILFTLDYARKGSCLLAYIAGVKSGEPEACDFKSADELGQLAGALEQTVAAMRERGLALEKAKLEAQAASAAKSDFLGNISHELYTPLNSIIGFSEVLADGMAGPLNEKQAGYIRNINSGGRALWELVDSLMDMAKLDSGETGLEASELAVPELAAFFREALAKKAGSKKLECILSPGGAGSFTGDARKLRRLLELLAANAAKFTPAGGSVTFAAARKEREMEFSVTDTGIGMEKEKLACLFAPFTRLETSLTKTYAGAGTGLYLAKKLLAVLGGGIRAASPGPGRGATFTFTVPLGPAHENKSQSRS